MDTIVTLEPWSPLPLLVPALLLAAAVVASVIGTRRRIKLLREAGYVAFIVAALAVGAMAWSMSGIWDTQQRAAALIALGYESPTFQVSTPAEGGESGAIGFQAVRDGERVRGVLQQVDDDQWQVVEVEPDED